MFSGVLATKPYPPALGWLATPSIVNHGFALLLALQAPALPEGQAGPALAFVGVDPSPSSLKGHVAALGGILAGAFACLLGGLWLWLGEEGVCENVHGRT